MLTEQERMNNALKEAIFREESAAKKLARLASQVTEPRLQRMLQGMEQACRDNFSALSATMASVGISGGNA